MCWTPTYTRHFCVQRWWYMNVVFNGFGLSSSDEVEMRIWWTSLLLLSLMLSTFRVVFFFIPFPFHCCFDVYPIFPHYCFPSVLFFLFSFHFLCCCDVMSNFLEFCINVCLKFDYWRYAHSFRLLQSYNFHVRRREYSHSSIG